MRQRQAGADTEQAAYAARQVRGVGEAGVMGRLGQAAPLQSQGEGQVQAAPEHQAAYRQADLDGEQPL